MDRESASAHRVVREMVSMIWRLRLRMGRPRLKSDEGSVLFLASLLSGDAASVCVAESAIPGEAGTDVDAAPCSGLADLRDWYDHCRGVELNWA